jgi:hypothetical protein
MSYVYQWNKAHGRVVANLQALVRQVQAASKHHCVRLPKNIESGRNWF